MTDSYCYLPQVEPGDNKDRVIVFFKIRPDVITPDNVLTNIVVSSMMDSPLNTLYHSMQKARFYCTLELNIIIFNGVIREHGWGGEGPCL